MYHNTGFNDSDGAGDNTDLNNTDFDNTGYDPQHDNIDYNNIGYDQVPVRLCLALELRCFGTMLSGL